MPSSSSSPAFGENTDSNRAAHRFETFRPREVPDREITVRSEHWLGFTPTEAHQWAGVLFLFPQFPSGATVLAAASQTWRSGGVPHLLGASDVAKAARRIGFTPQDLWQLRVCLDQIDPEGHPAHPFHQRAVAGFDGFVPFDSELWRGWPQRVRRGEAPETVTRSLLRAATQGSGLGTD